MPRPIQWPNQVVWSISDDQLAVVREVQKATGESEAGAARLLLDAGIDTWRAIQDEAEPATPYANVVLNDEQRESVTEFVDKVTQALGAQSSGSSPSDSNAK
jgi:hypothetical protein